MFIHFMYLNDSKLHKLVSASLSVNQPQLIRAVLQDETGSGDTARLVSKHSTVRSGSRPFSGNSSVMFPDFVAASVSECVVVRSLASGQ